MRSKLFFRYDLNKVQYALGSCVLSFVSKPLWLILSNACETFKNTVVQTFLSSKALSITCTFLKQNWWLGIKFLCSIIRLMRTCNVLSHNFYKMGRIEIGMYNLTLVGGFPGFGDFPKRWYIKKSKYSIENLCSFYY